MLSKRSYCILAVCVRIIWVVPTDTARQPHPEASARRPRKTDAPQKSSGAKSSAPVQTAHSKLNPEQQKAVCAVEPAVAVIAGPGTGKTKTLVSRAVHLLCEKQVSPRQLTAVTFTNKAAREMRERLTAELDKDRTIGDLTIGTFHSICLSLLRETGKAVTLLSQEDAQAVATCSVRPGQSCRLQSWCRLFPGKKTDCRCRKM